MSRWDEFIKAYGEVLNIPSKRMEFGRVVAEYLDRKDRRNINDLELSFKLGGKNGQEDSFRLMELDSDGYACRNREKFSERLEVYRNIVSQFLEPGRVEKIFRSCRNFPGNNLDLAFGVDMREKPVFGLWFMSLGDFRKRVKRDGTFPNEEVVEVLDFMGMKTGEELVQKLSNRELSIFGLDLEAEGTVYKFYWKRTDISRSFDGVSGLVEGENFLRRAQLSQRYGENGEFVDEKVYFEVERVVDCSSEDLMKQVLDALDEAEFTSFSTSEAFEKLSEIPGMLSWVGVDTGGRVTFYIRGHDA